MSHPNLKLVSFTMCAYVQRARCILLEKNVPHEIEYIDLDTPPDWFFDVSPLEKVPVLLVDDEALFESLVICDYIDDISTPSLYPNDALGKAKQRAWMVLGDTILDHVYDFMFATEEAKFKQARANIIDKLDVLEEELVASPFFNGSQFGMVDICFAPLFRFLAGIMQYSDFDFYLDTPQVKTWAHNCLDHPSVQQSVAENFTHAFLPYLKRSGTILTPLLK